MWQGLPYRGLLTGMLGGVYVSVMLSILVGLLLAIPPDHREFGWTLVFVSPFMWPPGAALGAILGAVCDLLREQDRYAVITLVCIVVLAVPFLLVCLLFMDRPEVSFG